MKKKIFSTLIILFLLSGILINGVMTETCLCIGPCSFGLQSEIDAKEKFLFHTHHANNHCKNCKVEDGQTLKTAVSSTSNGNIKAIDAGIIMFVLSDYPSSDHYFKDFVFRLDDYGIWRSLPTCLQNFPLRC